MIKKTKQSSFMKALEYMLKIADKSDYQTKTCNITSDQNGDIVIVLRNKQAQLTITSNNNGISYTGIGPKEEDQICTINTANYSVSSTVFEWIERNKK